MKQLLVILMLLAVVLTGTACFDDALVSSRAYSGHESDADANNFVRVFPDTRGTRLDDCQTCHGGGTITYSGDGGKTKTIDNPCTYCHIRVFEDASDYASGYPATYEDTLNAFGLAYKTGGRDKAALEAIKDIDSDSDTYSNSVEIADLRYPGDDSSKPGQPLAATITLDWDDVTAMTYHEQFMLLNTTKQQYDDYLTMGGVKISDFFTAAGVDLTDATGFTVFAPDGYQVSFDFADFAYCDQFPDTTFYHVTGAENTGDSAFINYPDTLPTGLSGGDTMSGLWMILAYQREGVNLQTSYYDSSDGRIGGEGPFRIIRPMTAMQNDAGDLTRPGRPDRGSKSDTYSDGWDFIGFDYDHNAGDAVKGTCVIRIDPMPAGYEEYDWKNGWSLIEDKKIVIYGHNVTD